MGKHPPFKGMPPIPALADVAELEASRADFDTSYEPHTTKVPEPNFTSGQGLNDLVRAGVRGGSRPDPIALREALRSPDEQDQNVGAGGACKGRYLQGKCGREAENATLIAVHDLGYCKSQCLL